MAAVLISSLLVLRLPEDFSKKVLSETTLLFLGLAKNKPEAPAAAQFMPYLLSKGNTTS
jgi:hypothetical protein